MTIYSTSEKIEEGRYRLIRSGGIGAQQRLIDGCIIFDLFTYSEPKENGRRRMHDCKILNLNYKDKIIMLRNHYKGYDLE